MQQPPHPSYAPYPQQQQQHQQQPAYGAPQTSAAGYTSPATAYHQQQHQYTSPPPSSVPYSHSVAASISGPYQPASASASHFPPSHAPPSAAPPPVPPLSFVPPPSATQSAIDALVRYIQSTGPAADAFLSEQRALGARSSYKFLFEQDPYHEYYLWRTYFIKQGNTEAELDGAVQQYWTQQQQQHHQPQPPHSQPHFPSPAAVSLPLSPSLRHELDDLLRHLDASKERIKAARQFIMRPGRPRDTMEGIVAVMREYAASMAQSHTHHAARLPLAYLVNDLVLAASKAGEGSSSEHPSDPAAAQANMAVSESLWDALLPHLIPLLAPAFVGFSRGEQEAVGRILDHWAARSLLPASRQGAGVITDATEIKAELQTLHQQHVYDDQQQHQQPQHYAANTAPMAASPYHPLPQQQHPSPYTPMHLAPALAPPPPTDVLHLSPAFVAQLSRAPLDPSSSSARRPPYLPLDPRSVPAVMPAPVKSSPSMLAARMSAFDRDIAALRTRMARRAARSASVSTSPSPSRGSGTARHTSSSSHDHSRRSRSRSRSRSRERSRSGSQRQSSGSARRGSRSRSRSRSGSRDRSRRSSGGGFARRSRSRSPQRNRRSSRSRSRSRDRDSARKPARSNWDSRVPAAGGHAGRDRRSRSRSPERRRR